MSKCVECNFNTCEDLSEDICCLCQNSDYDSMCSQCRADHSADLADDMKEVFNYMKKHSTNLVSKDLIRKREQEG